MLLCEWYPVGDATYTDIGIRDYNMTGYRFQEDGFCDYYPGYFEYADPDSGHLLAYPYRIFAIGWRLIGCGISFDPMAPGPFMR